MLAEFTNAQTALVKLTHGPYDASEIRDVLSVIGAKSELFLKSIVFPKDNPRRTFEWFINRLTDQQISQTFRGNLHALRTAYNTAKHDPANVTGLLQTLEIVLDARRAVVHLIELGIGRVNESIASQLKRVLWVAVWDHYIHGDSEVHIILPAISDHWLGPPTFDVIYVEAMAWDQIKKELSSDGSFTVGEGIVPQRQFEAFRQDEDFLGAWVFEGDYRTLITILARYELRQELLPGLNRQDRPGSMTLAFLLAAMDSITAPLAADDLAEAIQQQAFGLYAVPSDYASSQSLAEGMANMFLQIPFECRHRVAGPVWVGEDDYRNLLPEMRAKHRDRDIIIDKQYMVKMLWRQNSTS